MKKRKAKKFGAKMKTPGIKARAIKGISAPTGFNKQAVAQ
jgi:hypothetical protein